MGLPVLVFPKVLEPIGHERAVGHLRRYFGLDGHPAYTGSRFESLGGGGDKPTTANVITAEDIVSLSMLSIRMHGAAARRLLEDDDFAAVVTDYLTQIPADLDLVDAVPETYAKGSPADRLWRHLRGLYQVGQTTTSKLMARKRPRLIPVYDSVIRRAFGLKDSGRQWALLRELFTADDRQLHEYMLDLRKVAELPGHISALRVMDVVVWMEHRRPAEDEDDDQAVPVTD